MKQISRVAHLALLTCGISTTALAQATKQPQLGQPFSPAEAERFLDEASLEAREKYASMTFGEFKEGGAVFLEPFEGGKYIVNGDLPLATEEDLFHFYLENVLGQPPQESRLAVYHKDGEDVIWGLDEKSNLSYCVSDDFGSAYEAVVAAMKEATEAWSNAADVAYRHVVSEDSNCNATNPNVVFDVRPVDFGAYLARAFFPNEPRESRNILVDQSSFDVSGNLTLTGIIRHELGHTLGFRHEHTRPESGTCFEDGEWRGVTDYDAFSVMHYPQCNGLGDWSLTLTSADESGAACIYGPAVGFDIDEGACVPVPR